VQKSLLAGLRSEKRLPATIVLKALGFTNEALLKEFYPVETVKMSGTTFTRVVSDILVGMKAFQNIIAPQTKELIVKEGSKITRVAIKKMEASNIKEIPISKEDIINRITLKDIVDPETGEIILEGNELITEEIFKRILSSKTATLNLLFIDNVHYLSSLRDTLLTDKVNSKEDALVEIYRKLRPGEPPTIDAARELFSGLFFDPKRYDLSPVGRLKLNKRLDLDSSDGDLENCRIPYKLDQEGHEQDFRLFGEKDPGDVFRFFVRVRREELYRFVEDDLLNDPIWPPHQMCYKDLTAENYRDDTQFLQEAEDEYIYRLSRKITRENYAEAPQKKAAVLSCGKNSGCWKSDGRQIPWELPEAPVNVIHRRLATGSVVDQMNAHPFFFMLFKEL